MSVLNKHICSTKGDNNMKMPYEQTCFRMPARLCAWIFACTLVMPIGESNAQTPQGLKSISHNGRVQWSDAEDGPAAYELEFKNGFQGEWKSYWNNLFWKHDSDGAPDGFEAGVPMFFRLNRHPLAFPVPGPVQDSDFYDHGTPNPAKVELGRMLFFDKVLSGNMNISCATCHHSLTGTSDLLSLPIGEGGRGLGPTRHTGVGDQAIHERVPRNAPDIFNRGAREFERMFHDGRVELAADQPHGFRSPAGNDLPAGLDNVLAVQAMFPVTSGAEMAGQAGENLVADLAVAQDLPGVWQALAVRLQSIPEYVDLFVNVFDDVDGAGDITFVHAANAIAAFEAHSWRFDDTPFDRYLRGNQTALSPDQKRGMILFYGKAKCASCHQGPFLTDHDFHAIGMPQLGPGKGDGPGGREDFGREKVTDDPEDRYRFRTPSLRNVALTGPWGHDGAYRDLRQVVLHHLHPFGSLATYDRQQAVLPPRHDLDALDWKVMDDATLVDNLAEANELEPVSLSESETDQLLSFLHALTDPRALNMTRDIPMRVPSGIPLAE
jgi:cytochrome c peroxidase